MRPVTFCLATLSALALASSARADLNDDIQAVYDSAHGLQDSEWTQWENSEDEKHWWVAVYADDIWMAGSVPYVDGGGVYACITRLNEAIDETGQYRSQAWQAYLSADPGSEEEAEALEEYGLWNYAYWKIENMWPY